MRMKAITIITKNGAYTEIPMTWNDAKRTLTIDARRGCYEGMLDERKFTVRMPDGSEKTVLYKREKINVKFLVCHMILRTSFF